MDDKQIIKNTIAILRKLYSNYDVYKTFVNKYCETSFIIEYKFNDEEYTLDITKNRIVFSYSGGYIALNDIDERNRYEIQYLANKVYDIGQETTLNKMNKFAECLNDDIDD